MVLQQYPLDGCSATPDQHQHKHHTWAMVMSVMEPCLQLGVLEQDVHKIENNCIGAELVWQKL